MDLATTLGILPEPPPEGSYIGDEARRQMVYQRAFAESMARKMRLARDPSPLAMLLAHATAGNDPMAWGMMSPYLGQLAQGQQKMQMEREQNLLGMLMGQQRFQGEQDLGYAKLGIESEKTKEETASRKMQALMAMLGTFGKPEMAPFQGPLDQQQAQYKRTYEAIFNQLGPDDQRRAFIPQDSGPVGQANQQAPDTGNDTNRLISALQTAAHPSSTYSRWGLNLQSSIGDVGEQLRNRALRGTLSPIEAKQVWDVLRARMAAGNTQVQTDSKGGKQTATPPWTPWFRSNAGALGDPNWNPMMSGPNFTVGQRFFAAGPEAGIAAARQTATRPSWLPYMFGADLPPSENQNAQ